MSAVTPVDGISWGRRLGAHIEAARNRAQLSRRELALRMQVNEETVRRWERGGSRPSEERLARLIAILAIDGSAMPLTDDVEVDLPLLAELLRQERTERQITQAVAAAQLGVAQATYAGWEIGRSNPQEHHVEAVADFLGLAADDVRSMGREALVVDTSTWPPLGQLLGRRREALRLTRAELADRMGVSRRTIVSWELGYRAPRPQQLPELAAVLQVSTLELAEALPQVSRADSALDAFVRTRQRLLGLTRSEIARRIGTDEATFSRWLHGHRRPDEIALVRLAAVLEVPRRALPST